MRPANRLERLHERAAVRADGAEERLALGALGVGQAEQQVLGRDVVVAQRPRLFLGAVDDLVQLPGQARVGPGLLRVPAHVPLHALPELVHVHAQLLEDGNDDALLLRQQRVQEVQVVDERVPVLAGEPERVVERFGRFYGEAIWVDHERDVRMADGRMSRTRR